MPDYDIAIIGLGPAGSTLARLLNKRFKVIALDKKQSFGTEGFQKPCGGLLALDAQKAFIRFNLNLPKFILSDPQIFSVKTVDLESSIIRNYQRPYVNLNRHQFDLWLKTLIPGTVEVHHDTTCKKLEKTAQGYQVTFEENGEIKVITARYLIGADGANSLVRRTFYPDHEIRKYLAIQQWFQEDHATPFYSCIFDSSITPCYAWSISKDKSFIIGGAFEMKEANQKFEQLKHKLTRHQFKFGTLEKTEKCTVLCPSKFSDFICGDQNIFLIGEAAGFISASSLEGFSYSFDSAEILSGILNDNLNDPNKAYQKKTLKLRLKLWTKIIKANILTSPLLRKLIMMSRVSHVSISSGNE